MQYDIVVIGAGPAGLSFATALRGSGLHIAVVEQQSEADLQAPAYDGREIALTHLSLQILERLGVWRDALLPLATPIAAARVMNGTAADTLDFDSPVGGPTALGFMISNHHIRRALFERVREPAEVELLCEQAVTLARTDRDRAIVRLADGTTLQTRLLVVADGRLSPVRRMLGIPAQLRDFARCAVVCRMEHERPHQRIAYECFHYGRTLAVLPLGDRESSVVITAPAPLASDIAAMPEPEFSEDMRTRLGSRLGAMRLSSARFTYPLVGVHAAHFVAERAALIGDAAVGMHPVTAHGFNLGLRGQNTLSARIESARRAGRDFAARDVLEDYERTHMRVTRPLYHGTNGIVRLFTDDRPAARLLRTAVLHLSDGLPSLKQVIVNLLTETEPGRRPWLPQISR